MRVTRQERSIYEYSTMGGERLFIDAPYSCGREDASISAPPGLFVTVYFVTETPELRITEHQAFPFDLPRWKDAVVKLVSRRVDLESDEINAHPSSNLIQGFQSGASPEQQYLQSIAFFEIPAALSDLPVPVRERLSGSTEARFLDDDSRKMLIPLFTKLPQSFIEYPQHGNYLNTQIAGSFLSEQKEFVAAGPRGMRIYYFIPPTRNCASAKQPCRTYEYSYRIGTLQSELPRPVYDPSKSAFYVPLHRGLTYRSKQAN